MSDQPSAPAGYDDEDTRAAAEELRAAWEQMLGSLGEARDAIDTPALHPPPANPRNLAEGYTEMMAKYPDIRVVFRNDGPLTRERGLKNTEDVLVANPDLAAIYTANDDVALGATQAVLAANRKGKTLVTGMNGVPPALRSLKEGNLAMTVELNPVLWGRMGVDVLSEYLKGSKVEPRVFIKHVLIDSGNIDQKLPK